MKEVETKILIAIPSFNCQEQIIRVVDELTQSKVIKECSYEVIVIDNGSIDKTIDSAKEILEKSKLHHKVLKNSLNYGLGGSHKVAFQYAIKNNFEWVAIIHGDNQAVSYELDNLWSQRDSHDFVLGSRFMHGSRRLNYPLIRTAGNILLNAFFTLLSLRSMKDLGSGLNLFKVSMLKKMSFLECRNDFCFNLDLLLKAMDLGAKVYYYPITWREEDQVSNIKVFDVGYKALLHFLSWRFGVHKRSAVSEYEYHIVS